MESHRQFSRNLGRVLGVPALCLIAMVSMASAETITKSFEIGLGTSQPRSHFRTFTLPCRTRMVASITYSRSGAAGANNDVPIFIEVRKPGATAEEDGAVASVKENLTATRVPKTTNLAGAVSDSGGCSIPWRVRVTHDADGPAPNAVSGNITASFSMPTSRIYVAGGLSSLNRGESVTRNVGDSNGIGQGTLVITGKWNNSVLGVTGPNPVKLKFEFTDPNGNHVAVGEGFSANEIRDLPKLRLTYRIEDCPPAQWKLKITNVDNQDDAKDIDAIVNFTPDCP
ncbi:MAG: hypothetical protein ABR568_06190 [Pyrinomonadaceae bacterium]